MTIWKLSVSRSLTMVIAAFPSIVQTSRSSKTQSVKGAIDCIVVKDLSRFSRNYIDGGRYLEKIFPQLGIRFIAVNDAYDSLTGDPQSDSFVIPFKNLINDSYCKDISMKIRSSLEVKQKNGEFVGAFAPYGYKKSPDNKNQLIVDEAVSEYVQMIFAMYKDGFSIGRIAARLNQMACFPLWSISTRRE